MDKQIEARDADAREAELRRPSEATKDLEPEPQETQQVKGGYSMSSGGDRAAGGSGGAGLT
jgi:hypothetical protein